MAEVCGLCAALHGVQRLSGRSGGAGCSSGDWLSAMRTSPRLPCCADDVHVREPLCVVGCNSQGVSLCVYAGCFQECRS